MNKKDQEEVRESNSGGVADTWRNIMKDLYKLGVDTNDNAIIKQAVLGQTILDEQKQLEEWSSKMKG